MRVYRNQLYKNKILVVCGCVVLLIILTTGGYNESHIDTLIKNTTPENVWEFVSDFSKMKMLNPTILDFEILADTGSFNHWTYTVLYKEKLSHWPYSVSIIQAEIAVRRPAAHSKEDFLVESTHRTCFLNGLYCLYAEGEFKFIPIGPDTYVTEKVRYQCPPFMSTFCKREVNFQRKSIMDNLTQYFNRKRTHT